MHGACQWLQQGQGLPMFSRQAWVGGGARVGTVILEVWMRVADGAQNCCARDVSGDLDEPLSARRD